MMWHFQKQFLQTCRRCGWRSSQRGCASPCTCGLSSPPSSSPTATSPSEERKEREKLPRRIGIWGPWHIFESWPRIRRQSFWTGPAMTRDLISQSAAKLPSCNQLSNHRVWWTNAYLKLNSTHTVVNLWLSALCWLQSQVSAECTRLKST